MNYNSNNKKSTKKQWQEPKVHQIKLDNEISIMLQSPSSEPPSDPFKYTQSGSDAGGFNPYK